jgi:two-component system response regulator DegU
MAVIKLLVVDDHPVFRRWVHDVLSLEEGVEVVAEAASGEAALEVMRRLRPDVALVDVNLPDLNGHDVVRRARQEGLPTRIVLLTAYDDETQQRQALAEGAAAYCSKEVPPAWLAKVIRYVAAGRYVVENQVMDAEERIAWLDAHATESSLSPREMEVLQLLAQGMSNKSIARELGISEQTVKNHVTAILRKLHLEDRTQAAVYALQHGWVRLV